MRSFALLLVGGLLGYMVGHGSGTNTQVTYNTLGKKVVVASATTPRNAAISVGQECGEEGYFVVGTGTENELSILTAECTKKESPAFWSSWVSQ